MVRSRGEQQPAHETAVLARVEVLEALDQDGPAVGERGARVGEERDRRLAELAIERGREAASGALEVRLPALGGRAADLVGPAVLQEAEHAEQQREHREHQPGGAVGLRRHRRESISRRRGHPDRDTGRLQALQ